MGTAGMHADRSRGVVDETGAVHDLENLVIGDGSVIPTSIGVNPQETIITMTLRNAERWADRLGAERRKSRAA